MCISTSPRRVIYWIMATVALLALIGVDCSKEKHPTTPSATPTDCVDYGTYLHWQGSVATPGPADGVAVSDSHVYLADTGLQILPLQCSR